MSNRQAREAFLDRVTVPTEVRGTKYDIAIFEAVPGEYKDLYVIVPDDMPVRDISELVAVRVTMPYPYHDVFMSRTEYLASQEEWHKKYEEQVNGNG